MAWVAATCDADLYWMQIHLGGWGWVDLIHRRLRCGWGFTNWPLVGWIGLMLILVGRADADSCWLDWADAARRGPCAEVLSPVGG